jgi:hypothetical protein
MAVDREPPVKRQRQADPGQWLDATAISARDPRFMCGLAGWSDWEECSSPAGLHRMRTEVPAQMRQLQGQWRILEPKCKIAQVYQFAIGVKRDYFGALSEQLQQMGGAMQPSEFNAMLPIRRFGLMSAVEKRQAKHAALSEAAMQRSALAERVMPEIEQYGEALIPLYAGKVQGLPPTLSGCRYSAPVSTELTQVSVNSCPAGKGTPDRQKVGHTGISGAFARGSGATKVIMTSAEFAKMMCYHSISKAPGLTFFTRRRICSSKEAIEDEQTILRMWSLPLNSADNTPYS